MNDNVKTECDGNCNTCPSEYKLHCALTYSKRNNEMLTKLSERMDAMESNMQSRGSSFPTPIGFDETSSPQTSTQDEDE